MKQKKHDQLISIILIIYVLSIFLDLHIFYNSVSTLIRCLIATGFFIYAFFSLGTKKERKLLIGYYFLYLVFIVLHLLNIKDNSLLSEILYLYKMTTSLSIIYVTYKLKIDLKWFYKIFNICILLISGSIVVCNIFKLGYSSYDFNKIVYNIFAWFKYDELNYITASSKGFFHLTNQIVAVLLLYLPIMLIKLKEKINLYNVFCFIILLLSLLMLGNRISSLMPVIFLALSVIIYLITSLIKKERISYRYLALLLVVFGGYLLILKHAPIMRRYDYYDNLTENASVNRKSKKHNKNVDIMDEDLFEEEIRAIFDQKLININFPLYYYPYFNDQEFWNKMLKYDSDILYNARYIEKSIIKRVISLNNNKIRDALFGIGYDRIMNIQNIEQDYIMQYYSIGIIGIILLLGVYICIYIYMLLKMLWQFDQKFNYENLMLLLGIGSVLVTSYFSGNIFNAVSTMIPLSFVMGITLVEITKKKNNYPDYVLGFQTYHGAKKDLIQNVFEDSKDGQVIIYNINPLIISNFYHTKAKVEAFNKEKYNIPDGYGVVLASKMKDGNIKKTIAGIDLMEAICKESVTHKYKVYLYGAKAGIAEKAKEKLELKYPGIKIIGVSNGYVSEKGALKDIKKSKPDILFCALGSPKQENFIINNKDELKDVKIIMPVGGSFDVISGSIKRSPTIYSRLHLEWLYRMIKEPKRVKQNMSIIKYLILVIFKNDYYNEKENKEHN